MIRVCQYIIKEGRPSFMGSEDPIKLSTNEMCKNEERSSFQFPKGGNEYEKT